MRCIILIMGLLVLCSCKLPIEETCEGLDFCRYHFPQAWSGKPVPGCENLTIDDFCYTYGYNATPWQIVLNPNSMHTQYFECNDNMMIKTHCTYRKWECDPFFAGYPEFNQVLCEPNQDIKECALDKGVKLCD